MSYSGDGHRLVGEFGTWLDRLESDPRSGDERSHVFDDGVAARADPLIDQWKRETGYQDEPEEKL
jgi:hypothetical protein